jgi:two-component system sensor histidine kinase AtoS
VFSTLPQDPKAGPPTNPEVPSRQDSAREQHVRLRLMVALPTIMVLLLGGMGSILFHVVDSTFGRAGFDPGSQPMRQFSQDFLVTLGGFCLIGGLVGLATARQIIVPIQRLLIISERVAKGDLQVAKEPAPVADEVGVLHSSFNRMVDSLHSFFSSRNRMILESFTGGLITTDINGTIVAINSNAERMLSISAAHSVGRAAEAVLHRPDLAPLVQLLQQSLLQQSPVHQQELTLGLPGDQYHITAQASPMRDQQGQVHGLVLNLRDRDEFQQFMEEMSRADRLATLGTFSAGLAHEIRNPLGAIKGTSQLLAEITRDQPDIQNYVEIIIKEANRLNQLVREVQEFSHPVTKNTQPLDLNDLLREVVIMGRNHTGRAHGVQIVEDHGRIPLIMGSRDRLIQAILNVLINALQATPEQGRVTVVTRHTPTQDYPVVVRIHNTGSRIPPEVLKRIFEPFFTTKSAGSGLGLAIAHQVISHHGGRMDVANEPDGVAFTMRFPLTSSNHDLVP